MTTETNTFAPKKWTAEDFARADQVTPTTTTAPMRAEEPRSFGDVSSTTTAAPLHDTHAGAVHAPQHHEIRTEAAAETPMFAGPAATSRTRTVKTREGRRVSPLALAAIPAVALAAGVGYFAMQPRDAQVADASATTAPAAPILSGDSAPLTTTTASANGGVASVSSTTPAATAPAPRTEVASRATTTRVAANRARPAVAAPSASDAGVNVSATLPAGPVPYGALSPASPEAAAAPSAVTPPTIVAPAAPAAEAPVASEAPTPSVETPAPATPEASTPGAASETPTP